MAKWQNMLDSQTNHLQLTLKSKKLQFKYSNNVTKEVDHCIFQGFTFKNHESNFQKNSLVHWYLKPLWNKMTLFVCEYWHIIKISGVRNSSQIIVLMMVFTSIYKAVSLREILSPGEWMKLTILCSHKFEHIFQFKNMLLWHLPARFNADLPEEFLNSYMIGNLGSIRISGILEAMKMSQQVQSLLLQKMLPTFDGWHFRARGHVTLTCF